MQLLLSSASESFITFTFVLKTLLLNAVNYLAQQYTLRVHTLVPFIFVFVFFPSLQLNRAPVQGGQRGFTVKICSKMYHAESM